MDSLYYLSTSAYVLFLTVFRLLTVMAVYKSAKSHNLQTKSLWLIFTALFGIVSAAVYLIFEDKSNEALPKERRKAITLAIAAFLMIPLAVVYYFSVSSPVSDKAEEYDNTHFDKSYTVFYENENGQEVIYDKTGKAYTYDESENFTYYAKDGKTYKSYSEESESAYQRYGIICNETGEKYEYGPLSDWDYFIGEDGYIYIFNDTDLGKTYNVFLDPDEEKNMYGAVYYSKNGMLLYETSDAFWDKDGNLVFLEGYIYKEFKFSDIPKDQLDWD